MINRKDLIVCFVLRFVRGPGAAWRGTARILNGWIEADVFNIILIALEAWAIAAESAYTGYGCTKLCRPTVNGT